MIEVILLFTFAIAAGFYAAAKYRSSILPVWNPALNVWQAIRVFAIAAIAYGLWQSGRSSLQFAAILVAGFVGFYIAIERPDKDLLDDS